MDRIPSDHPSIDSIRARVGRYGGARRRLEVPEDIFPDAYTMRVVLDGDIQFGAIAPEDGWITGVYESPRLARDPGTAKNLLESWLDEFNRDVGTSVHVDVITPTYAIGLRAPGEREVYPTIDPPSSSLDDIAQSLDDT